MRTKFFGDPVGMGKCCVSGAGAGAILVDYKAKTVTIEGVTYKEGDYISLNGSTGTQYAGLIPSLNLLYPTKIHKKTHKRF